MSSTVSQQLSSCLFSWRECRQWPYGHLFGLLILLGASLLACARPLFASEFPPDVGLVVLVDESHSFTGDDVQYAERLYNIVNFMAEALGKACESRVCAYGVSRFSQRTVELLPPEPLSQWGERSIKFLDARPLDPTDQSNFPDAIERTCQQLSALPGSATKSVVLLTDGKLSSELNPNVAPIQANPPITRARFVRQMNDAVERCREANVRLLVLFVRSDVATDSYTSDQTEWQRWSSQTHGRLVPAEQPDDPSTIVAFLEGVRSELGLPGELGIHHSTEGPLTLGQIPPHSSSAQIVVATLKQTELRLGGPGGEEPKNAGRQTIRNRTSWTLPAPMPGAWQIRFADSASDDLLIVRSVVVTPEHYSLHLSSPSGPEQAADEKGLALDLEVVAGQSGARKILGTSEITATLYLPAGVAKPLTFKPMADEQIYRAMPIPPGQRPAAGLYFLSVPDQRVDGVALEEFSAEFTFTDFPFMTGWWLEPDIAILYAQQPVSFTLIMGNQELLASPPVVQVIFENGQIGRIEQPKQTLVAFRKGEYVGTLFPPDVGVYPAAWTAWVKLLQGLTTQEITYPEQEMPEALRKDLELRERMTDNPNPTPTPGDHSKKPNPQPSLTWVRYVGIFVLVALVLVLLYLLMPLLLLKSGPRNIDAFNKVQDLLGNRIYAWGASEFLRNIESECLEKLGSDLITDDELIQKAVAAVNLRLRKRYLPWQGDFLSFKRMLGKVKSDLAAAMAGHHPTIYREGASLFYCGVIDGALPESGQDCKDASPLDLYGMLLDNDLDLLLKH